MTSRTTFFFRVSVALNQEFGAATNQSQVRKMEYYNDFEPACVILCNKHTRDERRERKRKIHGPLRDVSVRALPADVTLAPSCRGLSPRDSFLHEIRCYVCNRERRVVSRKRKRGRWAFNARERHRREPITPSRVPVIVAADVEDLKELK